MPKFVTYQECATFFACWDRVSPPDDFYGVWEEHYPNGQLKFRGKFSGNQRREQQHLFFLEDGTLKQVSCWLNGWPIGTIYTFEDGGFPSGVTEFEHDGASNGNYVDRHFSSSFTIPPDESYVARLSFVHLWRNGELVKEWTHPDIRKYEGPDGYQKIIDDAVRMVYPNYNHEEDEEERSES